MCNYGCHYTLIKWLYIYSNQVVVQFIKFVVPFYLNKLITNLYKLNSLRYGALKYEITMIKLDNNIMIQTIILWYRKADYFCVYLYMHVWVCICICIICKSVYVIRMACLTSSTSHSVYLQCLMIWSLCMTQDIMKQQFQCIIQCFLMRLNNSININFIYNIEFY